MGKLIIDRNEISAVENLREFAQRLEPYVWRDMESLSPEKRVTFYLQIQTSLANYEAKTGQEEQKNLRSERLAALFPAEDIGEYEDDRTLALPEKEELDYIEQQDNEEDLKNDIYDE